ncbi:MAG: FAD-binding domain-containing protein [Oleiphilaceae bacterium]|nr:FAD-binding domain-containing protein [Oleiphilaceae bacterium]
MTQLVWLRNDLRLADNPALTRALALSREKDESVALCYILTPAQWQSHDWGAPRTDLLLRCLESLSRDAAALGLPMHLLQAQTFRDGNQALLDLCQRLAIRQVHANEEYAVNERRRDRDLKKALRARDADLLIYRDQTVVPVNALKTGSGEPYAVFTPFSRQWRRWVEENPIQLLPAPAPQGPALTPTPVPELASLRCERGHWFAAGEQAAHRALEAFTREKMGQYKARRDFPAEPATSLLSPYLALGVLSGRQCLYQAQQIQATGQGGEGAHTWITELCWRDFYVTILYHHPRVSRHRAYKTDTDSLPWNPPGEHFRAWCEGRTGIPLVDAAMRQLNQTGWMHNRLRMVTAMFLSKNLFIDWREGERYFMENLLDGYLASNNGGWQWSASTGTDAAPYFRIFNPVTQSERFDPKGDFIRHYVPEIAHLQGKAIHDPQRTGGVPGYPAPIVDLKESRKEAIARFQTLKK